MIDAVNILFTVTADKTSTAGEVSRRKLIRRSSTIDVFEEDTEEEKLENGEEEEERKE